MNEIFLTDVDELPVDHPCIYLMEEDFMADE